MNRQEEYQRQPATPEEAAKIVKPGDKVTTSGSSPVH